MEGHKFPIALDPGQSYSVMIVIVLGTAPAVDVELRWTDPAGEQQKTLNLSVYG